MEFKKMKSVLLVFALFMSAFAFSAEHPAEHKESLKQIEKQDHFNMEHMILHHIGNAHEFHIVKETAVPLPIILIDNGLKVFSSNKFYKEGEKLENAEGEEYFVNKSEGYALVNEKIYKLDNGAVNFNQEGEVLNAKPLDLSITKNVFAVIFSAVVLFIVMRLVAKSYRASEGNAPRGISKFLEPVILFVRDDVAIDNIGKEKYKRYMPFLLTVFFFIWFNSLIGLIPIFPGGTNITGNIAFTLTLALFTLILTVFSGGKHYWSHILTPDVPKWLYFIMIPIEIIGIFTKPFALTVRLFANMTAGHIIILGFVGIIFTFSNAAWGGLSVPMALFISVLELLVGVLQAFIFTVLSALFIGEAVAEH